MLVLYLKAIHIVFVVSWFAGLFYIIRLFIYHIEAQEKTDTERLILEAQFKIMEKRLWNIITTPAMVLTVGTGIAMLWANPLYLRSAWMWLKLGFVGGLLIYHFICARMLGQLKKDVFKYTSTQLRIWNEVATLLLVAIVFVVVLKNTLSWIWGVVGLLTLGIGLMLAIQAYKRLRRRKKG